MSQTSSTFGDRPTVAVLYGGASPEHPVSCISASAILATLDPERYRVVPVGITRSGTWVPGVGVAAATGVVVYFVCAAVSHLRARFLGRALWVNCMGMLALAVVVLVVAYLV